MRLIKHFKAPPTATPHTFENETGILTQLPEPEDTFAFQSQIIGIKNQVDDALYRMELNLGQHKEKVDGDVSKFAD